MQLYSVTNDGFEDTPLKSSSSVFQESTKSNKALSDELNKLSKEVSTIIKLETKEDLIFLRKQDLRCFKAYKDVLEIDIILNISIKATEEEGTNVLSIDCIDDVEFKKIISKLEQHM